MALSGLKNTFASWASAVALAATMALTPAAAEGNAPAQGTADLSTTHAAAAKVDSSTQQKTVYRQAGDYSLQHNAIGIGISRGQGTQHSAEELAAYFEGQFARQGVPAKAFVVEKPHLRTTVILFAYEGTPSKGYNFGNVKEGFFEYVDIFKAKQVQKVVQGTLASRSPQEP